MTLSETVPESWRGVLEPVLSSAKSGALAEFLAREERAGKAIYPPRGQRLAALEAEIVELRRELDRETQAAQARYSE